MDKLGFGERAREPDRTPPHLRLGLALIEADRPEEARLALQGASAVALRGHGPTSDPLYHWALACSSWLVGRWDEALIEVEQGLAAAESRAMTVHGAPMAGVGIMVAVHRDDLAGGWRLLERVQQRFAARSVSDLWFRGAEALLVEAEGRPQVALDLLADAWDQARPFTHASADRVFGPALVRLALRSPDCELARSVADEVAIRAQELAGAGPRGAALRCLGMFDEDAALLEEAVATLRPAGRPFEFAGACEQASAWLARAGARQRSQSLFAHALTAYRSLGAARDIERMLAGRARWGEAIPLAHHRRAERQPAVAARTRLQPSAW